MASCFQFRRWVPVVALVVMVSGCATGRTAGRSALDGAGQFGRGFGDAAAAPLEDFNLRRTPIPIVLLQARDHPYDVRNLDQCATIAMEVRRLDDALGPDTDAPTTGQGTMMSERVADAAAKGALDLVRDAMTDLVPGRSWIRRLSGAERHSDLVQSTIQAGLMRRAFLKGMGMQQNCAPPAAPSWFRPEPRRRR